MRARLPMPRLALAAALFTSAACAGDTNATAPQFQALTSPVAAAVDTALQDEYRAEQIYLRVLLDHGTVLPFYNIGVAEQRHSTALAAIYERRGLATPESDWTLDNVPRFPTVAQACAAGVIAERENIAMYDRLLAEALPSDIRTVFTNNRRASLERHLPAFETCR